MPSRPVPVTLITGFLGAGKTTLLNHLLRDAPEVRFAVVENEFGDVGIDAELVQAPVDMLYALNEGCVCCTVREDLVAVLEALSTQQPAPDHVIIEASGLADPTPVMRVVERAGTALHLNGVIAVVDARHAEHDLVEHPTWSEQIAYADVLVVNKVDLVDEPALARLDALLMARNPVARRIRVSHTQIPAALVLGLGRHQADLAPPHHDHHHHDAGVTSVAVTTPGEVDLHALDRWLAQLLHDKTMTVMRMKGTLALQGNPERFVLQAVRSVVDVHPDGPWEGSDRQTRLVVIGRELDEQAIQAGLDACGVDRG